MTATTLAAALKTAYSNTGGALQVAPVGATGTATTVAITQVGNTTVAYDDNYAYLTTTQGAGQLAGANVVSGSNVGWGFSTPTFGGFVENFGWANVGSGAAVAVVFPTAYTVNAYSITLSANATPTTCGVYPSVVTKAGFTITSNVATVAQVYWRALGQ